MEAVIEKEKINTPAIVRKRFSAAETDKMVQVGILPEASGWELIDGEIIHRLVTGSKHASVVNRLNQLLVFFLERKALTAVQNPVYLDEHNEPEPDIAVLKARKDFYAESHPTAEDVLLLIEVSDSTVDFDREVKRALYARAGIVEFWLINLKARTVEYYSQPKNGVYRLAQIFEKGETIESRTIESLTLKVEEILAS